MYLSKNALYLSVLDVAVSLGEAVSAAGEDTTGPKLPKITTAIKPNLLIQPAGLSFNPIARSIFLITCLSGPASIRHK
jgi:hypothetical protein